MKTRKIEEIENPFSPSSLRGNKAFASAGRASQLATKDAEDLQDARQSFLARIGAVGVNASGQPIGSTGGAVVMGAEARAQWDALNKAETPAAEPGFMSAGMHAENASGLAAPDSFILRALAKRPADRTPQEKEALRVRSRAEEITLKGGGKVMGGIMTDLIAEERAPEIGRREAKAGAEHFAAKAETLKTYGLTMKDGKMVPESEDGPATANPFSSGAKPAADSPISAPQIATARAGTSGGTMTRGGQTTIVPGTSAQPSQPPASELPVGARPAIGAVGFAMRTMPDGSVRTASGLDANGSSKMRTFTTREAAMEFYRPSGSAPTGFNSPGLPQAPTPVAAKPAPAMPPAVRVPPPGQDLDSGLPAGAQIPTVSTVKTPAPQTPEAARTTSPTARLEMAGGTPGAPVTTPQASSVGIPRPGQDLDAGLIPGGTVPTVSTARPPTAAATAKPPVDMAGLPTSEIFAQVTGARPTPGLPNIGFGVGAKELWARLTKGAIWNRPRGSGPVGGLYGESSNRNPFSARHPDYDMGTPKPNGYQEASGQLTVENPFLRQ